MGGPLSAAQLRSFAAEGVLILRSFVDEETLQLWDAQMAEQLEGDPADSATWAGGPANPRLTPALKDLPQMQAVLRQLGAGGWGGGSGIGGVRVKGASGGAGNMRPRADAAMGGSGNMKSRDPGWKAPDMGHIDGYGPGGWSGGFMLAATAHLVDVEEKGGAFIYWPRSHRAVNRFFQRHPERLDGSFRTMEQFWSGDPATSRQWEVLYADDFSSNIGVKEECEQFTGTCCFPADCLLPEC